MRFLVDENVPLAFIQRLEVRGHSIEQVRALAQGAADEAVLQLAVERDAVRLTFDRDFGTLIFLRSEPPPPGIVLLRLSPVELATHRMGLIEALEQAMAERGRFAVIGADGVRWRPLPRG